MIKVPVSTSLSQYCSIALYYCTARNCNLYFPPCNTLHLSSECFSFRHSAIVQYQETDKYIHQMHSLESLSQKRGENFNQSHGPLIITYISYSRILILILETVILSLDSSLQYKLYIQRTRHSLSDYVSKFNVLMAS